MCGYVVNMNVKYGAMALVWRSQAKSSSLFHAIVGAYRPASRTASPTYRASWQAVW